MGEEKYPIHGREGVKDLSTPISSSYALIICVLLRGLKSRESQWAEGPVDSVPKGQQGRTERVDLKGQLENIQHRQLLTQIK